jgi:hypothetical protein
VLAQRVILPSFADSRQIQNERKNLEMAVTKAWHYVVSPSTKLPIHDQRMLVKWDEWVDPRGKFTAQIQKPVLP